MKITNKYDLPWALVRAASRDNYSRGASRKSVTQLISSPRIDCLREKHASDMSADLTDRIWLLLGSAVHHILDMGAEGDHVTEERLFTEIGGWVISGQIDVQKSPPGIIDYKVCSVFSVMFDKPEWEHQLNAYAYLVWVNKGIAVQKLQICAILRDWRKSDTIKSSDYPQQPIVMVNVPIWTAEDQLAYLTERVAAHQAAAAALMLDTELPPCSDEDRWIRDSQWAVFKPGGKRAARVFDNEPEAAKMALELDGRVERRGGEPKRCLGNYCGVADWCTQWQAEQNLNL